MTGMIGVVGDSEMIGQRPPLYTRSSGSSYLTTII